MDGIFRSSILILRRGKICLFACIEKAPKLRDQVEKIFSPLEFYIVRDEQRLYKVIHYGWYPIR